MAPHPHRKSINVVLGTGAAWIAVTAVLAGAPASAAPASLTAGAASGTVADSAHRLSAAGRAVLVIRNSQFSTISVRPRQVIKVVNKDQMPHTVTSAKGGFSVAVAAGGTATFTAPSASGRYPLRCKFHSGMSGTLTVV